MHVHVRDGQGLVTPEPHKREVRVLLSPLLQPELQGTGVMVGYTEVGPGQEGSYHKHQNEAEVWLFYAGRGRAVVGDNEYQIEPGSVVYTAAGVYHQFFNDGDEPVKLFWYYSPPGAEAAVLDGRFR